MPKKKISGTNEWSVKTVNCCDGCPNDCRYCYAASRQDRFKRIPRKRWKYMRIREHDLDKLHGKYDGTVMFPSTHDIVPENMEACLTVLKNLLISGNRVLIVSKPRIQCVERLCIELEPWREQVMFRFTIGACDDHLLKDWEPNAPTYVERKSALIMAYAYDYATSVSIEPMLDSDNVALLFYDLKRFVTGSIWIGKMNDPWNRVKPKTKHARAMVQRVVDGQSNERIRAVYTALKDDPKVRWKESIKKVVGLKLATKKGTDR